MAGSEELTIAQAAVIVGGPSTEAARRRVERAIRDNKLAWHPGPGGTRKLIYRSDLVAWITAPSDELVMNSDNPNGNNTDNNNAALLDITSENRSKKPLLGYREAAWGLAGMLVQQGREVERLRAELEAEREERRALIGQLGEERGRRVSAEQRAQALTADAEARAERQERRWRLPWRKR